MRSSGQPCFNQWGARQEKEFGRTVIALLFTANVCGPLTARATLPRAAAAGSEKGSWTAEAG